MSEIDWAALRAAFKKNLKNGAYGRPRLLTVQPIANKPSAPKSPIPAASNARNPDSALASGLGGSKLKNNHDFSPLELSHSNGGSKRNRERKRGPRNSKRNSKITETSPETVTTPFPSQNPPTPVRVELPPHLRLLATPNNVQLSHDIPASDCLSGTGAEPAAVGTSVGQVSCSNTTTKLEVTSVGHTHRLTKRESEDPRGYLLPSEDTLFDTDWAAQRAEFAERVRSGIYGRPRMPTVLPNANKASALRSYISTASNPRKLSSALAPRVYKSKFNANDDCGPFESSDLHIGTKENIHNTVAPLESIDRPSPRQIPKAPIEGSKKTQKLPPHIRLLATPNNAKASDCPSRTRAKPDAAGSLVGQVIYSNSTRKLAYADSRGTQVRRELEDSRGYLLPSEDTISDTDWAARRAEFAERVQNGDFGRPRVPSSVPQNGIFSIEASRLTES